MATNVDVDIFPRAWRRARSSWLASPATKALAAVGALGFFVGLILLFVPVSVASAACGSVAFPVSTFQGETAQCGPALSVQAVRVGAALFAGAGFLVAPIGHRGASRLFLLLGLTVAAASVLNLFDNGGLLDLIAAVYALGMAIAAGRVGLHGLGATPATSAPDSKNH